MAGHMRRGDFAILGWTTDQSIENHFERIKKGLADGREALGRLRNETVTLKEGVHSPAVDSLPALSTADPPRSDDKFFLMTDERSPEAIAYIRSHGAILVQDLLTPEDHRILNLVAPKLPPLSGSPSSSPPTSGYETNGTDDSSPVSLRYPALLFTDLLSIVEQSFASHAAYFWGQAMSSVSGGVVNLRKAEGWDPRWTHIQS